MLINRYAPITEHVEAIYFCIKNLFSVTRVPVNHAGLDDIVTLCLLGNFIGFYQSLVANQATRHHLTTMTTHHQLDFFAGT